MRWAGIKAEDTIFNKSVQLLGYAGDINVVESSRGPVEEAFRAIGEKRRQVSFEVNENNIRCILSANKDASVHSLRQNVTFDDYNFEVVKEYT